MMQNQNSIPSNFNLDEFSKNSEEFYNKIKSDLEVKYKGKYAAIDFESKKYWIGETASDALSKAKTEFPLKLFYLVQVGSTTTFTVQSMMGRTALNKSYGTKWAY